MRSVTSARGGGQAAVEFAVGLTLLLLLVVGALDLGRGVWVRTSIAHAAREAARYGSIPTRTSAEIRDYAIQRATGIGLTAADVGVGRGVCGDPASPVVVTITYGFVPLASGIVTLWGGGDGIAMGASSSMYVERGVPPCAG
jgi:Flp pilus assembly protein TadG